jgi:glycosyltransferase involved in cell wall biosynthesis
MKVALFGHKARKRGNGLVRYSKQLRKGLEAHGAQVVFLFHASSDDEVEEGAGQTRLRSLRLWDHDLITLPGAKALIERALVSEQANVAHVSMSFSHLDFGLPQLCHNLGIPIVATFHAPYDRRLSLWGIGSRLFYRIWAKALARYDAVVVFSQAQRHILAQYGVSAQRIHVIPNGVDTDIFRPGASDYKQEVEAELLVVYCGRLDPEKNVGSLLQAFQDLALPPSHMAVVVGNGVEYRRLRERYEGEGVIFTGLIKETGELLRILRGGDIFVLPSGLEGLSIAMLEAMGCGMATIATDVGCDGEALRGAGIVIDPHDLESQLKLGLRILVENPEFRRSLAEKARERVMARYSLERNIGQVTNLYQQLLLNA